VLQTLARWQGDRKSDSSEAADADKHKEKENESSKNQSVGDGTDTVSNNNNKDQSVLRHRHRVQPSDPSMQALLDEVDDEEEEMVDESMLFSPDTPIAVWHN